MTLTAPQTLALGLLVGLAVGLTAGYTAPHASFEELAECHEETAACVAQAKRAIDEVGDYCLQECLQEVESVVEACAEQRTARRTEPPL